MSGFSIEQLKFDPTEPEDTHNVGAYVRASDGTLITHTTEGAKEGLDVNIINPSLVVTATDLDIRDLDHAQDNVSIAQGGNTMVVNADGSINVNADISVVNGHEKAEDAASASGDIGSYVLSVRQDVLAGSTSTDGDFQSFKTDAVGALWTNQYKTAPASGSNGAAAAATSVTATATLVPAVALTNRTVIVLQNRSNNTPVTLGFSNAVTFGAGPILSPGSSVTLEVGPTVTVYAIADTGKTANIAHYELGYTA